MKLLLRLGRKDRDMSFIRAKEIPPHSGNWYDYEVKTVHEGSKVRQKVIRYIGKSAKVKPPSRCHPDTETPGKKSA